MANLITAVFFLVGIVGTDKLYVYRCPTFADLELSWFEYKSDGVTFTSGNFGGCVKYAGCDTCVFWKDRNANGTESITDPVCHLYSTNQYKPASKWCTYLCCAAESPY